MNIISRAGYIALGLGIGFLGSGPFAIFWFEKLFQTHSSIHQDLEHSIFTDLQVNSVFMIWVIALWIHCFLVFYFSTSKRLISMILGLSPFHLIFLLIVAQPFLLLEGIGNETATAFALNLFTWSCVVGASWFFYNSKSLLLSLGLYIFMLLTIFRSNEWSAVFNVLAALAFCALYFVIEENAEVWKDLKGGIKSRRVLLCEAIAKWSFLGILLITGFSLTSHYTSKWTNSLVFEIPQVSIHLTDKFRTENWKPPENKDAEVEADTDQWKSLAKEDFLHADNEKRRKLLLGVIMNEVSVMVKMVEVNADESRSFSEGSILNTKDAIIAAHDSIFPPVERIRALRSNPCRNFPWIGCWVINEIKANIRSTYFDLHSRSKATTIDKVTKGGATSDEVSRNFINSVEQNLKDSLNSLADGIAERTLSWIYGFIRALALFNVCILIAMLLKSFMVVFSRIAFSGPSGNTISLKHSNTSSPVGNLSSARKSGIFNLKASVQRKYYHSLQENASPVDPDWCVPNFFSAAIPRLFAGRYVMRPLTLEAGVDVEVSSSEGRSYVEWTIPKGETIAISLGNLAIMSENIRLATHVNVRLPALLFGRMLFTVATPVDGEGTVVFSIKGDIDLSADKGGFPERLIAFNETAGFSVYGKTDWFKIYFCPYNLKPESKCSSIFDRHDQSSKTGGVLRDIGSSVRSFFLPW